MSLGTDVRHALVVSGHAQERTGTLVLRAITISIRGHTGTLAITHQESESVTP